MAALKLDVRVALYLYITNFLMIGFVYDFFWVLILMILPFFLMTAITKVSIKRVIGPALPTLIILGTFLFLVNFWYYPFMYTVYNPKYTFWIIPGIFLASLDGVSFALQATGRFLLILLMMASFTKNIPISDLTGILYRLHVPSSIVLALSVGMSYIPVLTNELETIRDAQQARAWRVKTRNPVKKAKAWAPLLIPAVKSATRRAGELASAIESRGFGVEMKRTVRKVLKFSKLDYVYLAVTTTALALGIVYGNRWLKVAYWTFTADLIKALFGLP